MTEAHFIAAEQAKQDLKLASDLKRVQKTGCMSWSKAEAMLAHGLITGAMQHYALTDRGAALIVQR